MDEDIFINKEEEKCSTCWHLTSPIPFFATCWADTASSFPFCFELSVLILLFCFVFRNVNRLGFVFHYWAMLSSSYSSLSSPRRQRNSWMLTLFTGLMFQLLYVLYLGQYIFVIQESPINLFVIDIGGSVDCLFNGQTIHIFGSIMESGGLPEVDYFWPNSAGSCQRVESTGFILNITELDWIQSLPLMFFLIPFSHYFHHFSFNESHFAFSWWIWWYK